MQVAKCVVTGDKASTGSIAKVTGYVLLLLAHEVSDRQIVVVRGVVRPLPVKASGGNIPATGESPAQAKASQASGGDTIEMMRG